MRLRVTLDTLLLKYSRHVRSSSQPVSGLLSTLLILSRSLPPKMPKLDDWCFWCLLEAKAKRDSCRPCHLGVRKRDVAGAPPLSQISLQNLEGWWWWKYLLQSNLEGWRASTRKILANHIHRRARVISKSENNLDTLRAFSLAYASNVIYGFWRR